MGGPGRVVEIGLISLGTSTQVTTSVADSDTIRWNNAGLDPILTKCGSVKSESQVVSLCTIHITLS